MKMSEKILVTTQVVRLKVGRHISTIVVNANFGNIDNLIKL